MHYHRLSLLGALLLVGALASVTAVPAQVGSALAERQASRDHAARVDALFSEWDRPGSPGAAVAVVRDGEIVHARGYGLANLEYDVPITPSTVFHIASVSKHFTAFAIGLLAADGKLGLDDDIRTHVPEVPDFGSTITIRQLIHHTSGLRDQWELLAMAGWRLDDVITREHILKMVANQRELNFAPGAEHLYSNTGYTLMAEIVQRVSGQAFGEFMDERVFRPLGMRNTHFHEDHQRIVPNRAYSYEPVQPVGGFRLRPLNYANVGATSLFTTVEDLARWERNFYTAEVGGAAVLEEMLTRGVLNDGRSIDYAHGLVLGEHRGLATIGHGGADAGYRTAYLRFPDQRLSVIVFANLASFNPMQLAQAVAAVYLEKEMKAEPRRQRAPNPRPVRLSDAELRILAGVYANPANDQVRRLEVRDGALTLLIGGGYELAPVGRNRFVGVDTPVPVEVRFEPRGNRDEGLVMREILGDGEPSIYEPAPIIGEEALLEFAGSYYSEELGTTYTFVVEGGRLLARHRRHADTRLTALSRDRFAGENWWFQRVAFTRDENGAVDGLRLTGGRVRNLRFVRVEEGAAGPR